MRRRIKDLHIEATSSRFPLSRLFSMFVMLVVVSMVFVRMGDRKNRRWVADRAAQRTMVIGKNGLPERVDGDSQLLAAGVGGTPFIEQPPAGSPAAPSASESSAPSASSSKSPSSKESTQSPSLYQPFVPSGGSDSATAHAVVVEGPKGASSPSLPSATGPTDEDPEEREFMEEARLAIKDGREHTTPAEMAAYQHVLAWAEHQPIDRLAARAQKGVPYDSFMFDTDRARFKLVDVTLNLRQIVVEPYKTDSGLQFYELRGFSADSGQLLYFGMVTGLPQGMPVGDINEQVRLIGYFYKKQGYQSQASITKAKHLEAPLIVGRIVWQKSDDAAFNTSLPPWLLVSIAGVACLAVASWVFFVRRQFTPLVLPPLRVSRPLEDEGPSVDNWLDQAQAGRLTDESGPVPSQHQVENSENGHSDIGLGNIFDSEGDSNNGHSQGRNSRSDPDLSES